MAATRLFAHPGTPSGHVTGLIYKALSSLVNSAQSGVVQQQWDAKARFALDTPTSLHWTLQGDSSTWDTLTSSTVLTPEETQEGTIFSSRSAPSAFGMDAILHLTREMVRTEFPELLEAASVGDGSAQFGLNHEVAGAYVFLRLPIKAATWAAELKLPITQQVMHLSQLAAEAGLASDQAVYEDKHQQLLQTMDELNKNLEESRFLTSSYAITLADLLLFSFLVRFEPVHHALHKCNMHLLEEAATIYSAPSSGKSPSYTPQWQSTWPNLLGFGRDIWASLPGAADASPVAEISKHHWLTFGELLSGREVEIRGLGPDWWFPPLARFARFVQTAEQQATASAGAAVTGVAGNSSDSSAAKGAFIRGTSGFRANIGDPDFPAEPGRYHLFVANNCPWCHRATLARAVKGLRDVVSVDVLAYRRDPDRGWQFDESYDPEVCTPLSEGKSGGLKYIPDLYAVEGSKERSVPLLYDTMTKRIVNNESAEIVRVLNSAFPDASSAAGAPDLYPAALRPLINQLNSWIYPHINNGAYQSGFASSQAACDEAYPVFFAAMERLERLLATTGSPFLAGGQVTEADIRLFPTIYRFDAVYYTRFKLNRASLGAFPALKAWLDRMLQSVPGVAEASSLKHCKAGYYGRTGTGLVPSGPAEYHRLLAVQGERLQGQPTEIVGALPTSVPEAAVQSTSIV